MGEEKRGSKDQGPQGKSHRTGRGQASPGGSGTPPGQRHQAAGQGQAVEPREDERTLGRTPDKGRQRG
jgi:hypothetical protein